MDKKFHFVYQTKNIVNGKTYIGVHSTNNLSDGYIGSGVKSQKYFNSYFPTLKTPSYFLKAVKKYGVANFRVEILNFYNSREEALEEEAFLVDENWVLDVQNYNTALGGPRGGCISKHKPKYEAIKQAFFRGNTIKEICMQYNISKSSVREILYNCDKSARDYNTIFEKRYAHFIPQIEALVLKNESVEQISIKLDISCWMIYKIINQESFERPLRPFLAITKEGVQQEFVRIKDAALEFSLHGSGIGQALRGQVSSYKDWVFIYKDLYNPTTFCFPTRQKDKYIGLKMLSPEGEIHTLDTDLTTFCRKYDIRSENVHQIFNGEVEQIKGWKVLSKEFIKTPFKIKTLKFESQSEVISKHLASGLSPFKIAKLLNTSPGCIKTVIKKLNL